MNTEHNCLTFPIYRAIEPHFNKDCAFGNHGTDDGFGNWNNDSAFGDPCDDDGSGDPRGPAEIAAGNLKLGHSRSDGTLLGLFEPVQVVSPALGRAMRDHPSWPRKGIALQKNLTEILV
jgi:hypothetical protein